MRGIRCFAYFAVLSISALALDAPKPPAPDQPSSPPTPANYSNIILITMDTTRADRMGFLGSERGLTPNLDALALDSVVFTRAYAQAPLTPASHATILTGTYPQYHQVFAFFRRNRICTDYFLTLDRLFAERQHKDWKWRATCLD